MRAPHINREVTDYYVCGFVALWLCGFRFSIFDFRFSNVAYPVRTYGTVRCTYEVMCYCVWYGTVRYGTSTGTVMCCTVPYRTVWYIYRTVRYRTENLKILERGAADPI